MALGIALLAAAVVFSRVLAHASRCPGRRWGADQHAELSSLLHRLRFEEMATPGQFLEPTGILVRVANDLVMDLYWTGFLIAIVRDECVAAKWLDKLEDQSLGLAHQGHKCRVGWLPHKGKVMSQMSQS